jgi:DNA-binding NtrC family response regulator
MRALFERLPRVASSHGTVLVLGETGSGKELVARAIHDLSPRREGPFVAINCGAISAELVESELFGHEKGAFTGALAARRGAFEQAHGGTLFLDEVGELPAPLQPRLLRALETGEIRRVGAQAASRADVRIVAATHRDLRGAVEAGAFRADLLYRLFVLPLPLPPLRERRDDILPLARHFLGGRCPLDREAERRLLAHPWPGNVRELRNVLERACILRAGEPVGAADLVFLDDRPAPALPWGQTLEELERTYFARALEMSGGNLRAAARTLGIPKSTFFDRVRKYGLRGSGEE